MRLMYAQFICLVSSSHLLQDLDFNLRISGQERQEGGKSSKLSEDAALNQPFGGAWLSEKTVTEAGEVILESTDPPGPAVVVKCYRFAYRQDQSIKKVRGNACPHATRPRCQRSSPCHVSLMPVLIGNSPSVVPVLLSAGWSFWRRPAAGCGRGDGRGGAKAARGRAQGAAGGGGGAE